MTLILICIGVVLVAERAVKHGMVLRFFRRRVPPANPVGLVSLVQPILSGDPTLPACLEHNLRLRSSVRREYIWLVDDDDAEGQRICRTLIERHPEQSIRLLLRPPPGERENPKMVKLIAGLAVAQGDVLCVLDDDTMLPDGGLERCLPFLDLPGVGLAFGLPFYTSFGNLWSRLVAYFVGSHSLMTYVPYTALTEPVTINGMFYALRRTTFDAIGGFHGLEYTLADDFAVAQRLREHGFRLAQTPVCHGISTHVAGPRQYLNLMQRWFIFPRESLMRHLPWRNLLVLYGVALLPAFFPWLVVGALLVWPSIWTVGYALLYLVYNYAIFADFNLRFFNQAAPWKHSWLVPLIQLTFPLQLLVALLAPQRITWRGHQMQVEGGGTFRFVRRRGGERGEKRL